MNKTNFILPPNISEEDLRYIHKKSKHIKDYLSSFVHYLNYLGHIPNSLRITRKYLEDMHQGCDPLNRSFMHLYLATILHQKNLLHSVEQGHPPCDFLLKNGLRVELCRLGDDVALIQNGIHKIIAKNNFLIGKNVYIHCRTLSIKRILAKIKNDLSRLCDENTSISREDYDIRFEERSNELGEDLPLDTLAGNTYMASTQNYGLFITLPPDTDQNTLLKLLATKVKKSAASQSDILIIDLTDSVLEREPDHIQDFLRLAQQYLPRNIELVLGTFFLRHPYLRISDPNWIIHVDANDRIKEAVHVLFPNHNFPS